MRLFSRSSTKPLQLNQFREAIVLAGAELIDPTNEWEVLRYRHDGKIGILYRNKKNLLTPSGVAAAHLANFEAGREIHINSKDEKRLRRAGALQLFTDASNHHETKSASWAGILVADGVEHEASGPLKGEITSSTAAEARAVANALHHFAKAGLIDRDVRVFLDNQNVVKRIRSGSHKGKCKQTIEAIKHIQKIARGRFIVYADWIKGHQPKALEATDHNVRLNRRCDELAALHSRKLHEERRGQSTNVRPEMPSSPFRQIPCNTETKEKAALHNRERPPLRELKPQAQGETP